MGNPLYNCAALICCPPESRAAIEATAKILIEHGCPEKVAYEAAPYVQEAFDVAKKGTLQPLKDWIVEEARGPAYKPED